MKFNYEQAKNAGYSDSEIADFLGNENGFDTAGARSSGYSDAELVQHLAAPPERSTFAKLGRQVGLTARAGIKGTVGLLAIPGDMLGMKSSKALDDVMTMAGLPEPENATERVAQDVAGAMTGTGAAAKALPKVIGAAGSAISSAGAGAGASGTTRELDGGPMAQFVAGTVGGVAAPAAATGAALFAEAAARGARGLVQPITEAGRNQIAADVLKRSASSATRATANLDAPELVPDSVPTTAQASRDPGLLSLEKNVRNTNPSAFMDRQIQQNAARVQHLASVAKTPEQIEAARAARDAWATETLQTVFANKRPADTSGAVKAGVSMLNAGAKYRGEAGGALQRFVDDVAEIKDPEVLYNGPRKAIGDVLEGRAAGDSPLKVFTRRELMRLRSEIDFSIEKAAPGFGKYLSTYKGLSRPIDKWESMNELRGAVTNPIGDVSGNDVISAAKFATQSGKVAGDLSPSQRAAVEAVNADLQRSAQSASATRAPGSDTAQNIIGAHVVRQATGAQPSGAVSGLFAKPISMLYRATGHEAQTQNAIMNAMLDPALGRQLMLEPTTAGGINRERYNAILRAILLGGNAGTAFEMLPHRRAAQ